MKSLQIMTKNELVRTGNGTKMSVPRGGIHFWMPNRHNCVGSQFH